jgi:hypothetical protein
MPTTTGVKRRGAEPQRNLTAKAQVRPLYLINVKDGLPDSDTTVIAQVEDGEFTTAFHDGDAWRDAGSAAQINVSHWAHFPEPAQPVLCASAPLR